MIESCIVVHCGANQATDAPQTFFYNNKLQFNDPTTNQVVGSSNLSGRTKKSKALQVRAFTLASFMREFRVTYEPRNFESLILSCLGICT